MWRLHLRIKNSLQWRMALILEWCLVITVIQKTPRGLYSVSRTMSGDFFVEFKSVVCGYHVYRSIWTPVLGELLYTEQELGNPEDRYAVHVDVKIVDYRRTHCNY